MSLYMCFLHIVPLFWLSLPPFWRWLSWPLVICDTNDLDLNRWPWILTINIHVKRVWVYTLVLTQSSTILVMAFMTLGSDVFSIRPTRIWPMKLFLISRDITPTLFLTRSRLRISNSLATVNKEYQRSWSKKKIIERMDQIFAKKPKICQGLGPTKDLVVKMSRSYAFWQ